MAALLLAALDNDKQDTEPAEIRAYAGALLIVDLLLDVRDVKQLFKAFVTAQR